MRAICQHGQARITLPMPDAWRIPEGETMDAGDTEWEAEALQDYLHRMPCPACGSHQVRIRL